MTDHDEVALGDAAAEDFVMLGPGWELRTLSEELCTRAGLVPRVVFEEDDIPVVRGVVLPARAERTRIRPLIRAYAGRSDPQERTRGDGAVGPLARASKGHSSMQLPQYMHNDQSIAKRSST